MIKKCLFTQSTDNVNTSVIVDTDIGPVTVHVCDAETGKTIAEVVTAVEELMNQARTLADTFGFDFTKAMAQSDVIFLTPVTPIPVASVASHAVSAPLTAPAIPSVVPAVPVASAPPVTESTSIPVSGKRVKHESLVQSPHGRQFSIPNVVVDETGATVIGIDTESEKNFNQLWEQQKREKVSGTSFLDSYNVQFQPCKLCIDPKTKQPTGILKGVACPKCKGAAEIMVQR